MRYLRFMLVPLLFVACTDTQPVAPDIDIAPSFKVDRFDLTFDYDVSQDPPYDCGTGELLFYEGTVLVHVGGKITPSGNVITGGGVDYNAYGDITLVGETTETVWTLTSGRNPFHDVEKENGFYVLHYRFNEHYVNEAGERIRVNLKGYFRVDKDGVETFRESYTCQ